MKDENDLMPWYFSAGIATLTTLLLAVALLLSYYYDDAQNRAIIIGAIIANSTTIVSWMFGSSKGSQKKDETISAFGNALAVSTPGTPTPPMEPAHVPVKPSEGVKGNDKPA